MSLGASEELRFYINLLKNNLFGPKYDLYKIPGPTGYRLAGGCRPGTAPLWYHLPSAKVSVLAHADWRVVQYAA
jgi:hypothetical protein